MKHINKFEDFINENYSEEENNNIKIGDTIIVKATNEECVVIDERMAYAGKDNSYIGRSQNLPRSYVPQDLQIKVYSVINKNIDIDIKYANEILQLSKTKGTHSFSKEDKEILNKISEYTEKDIEKI